MYEEIQCTPGVCPECEHEGEMEYGELTVQSGMVYYPMTCGVCGLEGREWYDIVYLTTAVTKWGKHNETTDKRNESKAT
jgi:hypothetical protein